MAPMPDPACAPSTRSALVLAALLEAAKSGNPEVNALVAKLRRVVERSMLFRFATGRRTPDATSIAHMHEATGGLVAAHGWAPLAGPAKVSASRAPRTAPRRGRPAAQAAPAEAG